MGFGPLTVPRSHGDAPRPAGARCEARPSFLAPPNPSTGALKGLAKGRTRRDNFVGHHSSPIGAEMRKKTESALFRRRHHQEARRDSVRRSPVLRGSRGPRGETSRRATPVPGGQACRIVASSPQAARRLSRRCLPRLRQAAYTTRGPALARVHCAGASGAAAHGADPRPRCAGCSLLRDTLSTRRIFRPHVRASRHAPRRAETARIVARLGGRRGQRATQNAGRHRWWQPGGVAGVERRDRRG